MGPHGHLLTYTYLRPSHMGPHGHLLTYTYLRPSQGFFFFFFFWKIGNNAIYFRGTRKQKSKNEGNRGTKAILGIRELRKSRF